MERAAAHYGITYRSFRRLVNAGVLASKSKPDPTCATQKRYTVRCHVSGNRADIFTGFVAFEPAIYDDTYFETYRMVRSVSQVGKGHPHPRHIVAGAYDLLTHKGLPTTRETMTNFLGGSRAEVTDFLKQKFAATVAGRVVLRNRYASGAAEVTLDDLRRALPNALRTAPYTCLDEHPSETWREPPPNVIRRILAIRHEQLRNAAALWTVNRMTSKVSGDHLHGVLKAVMALEILLGDRDISQPDVVGRMMRAYLIDKSALADDTDQTRYRAYRMWLVIHNGVEGYLKTLPTPEQRMAFSRFQIALPHNTTWFTREVWDRYGSLAEATEEARKERSDLLSNRYDEIRFIVEIRLQQASRLLSAYNQAVAALRALPRRLQEPFEVSYIEPVRYPDGRGSGTDQRVKIRIWSMALLRYKLCVNGPRPDNRKLFLPGGRRHIPREEHEHILEYVGVEPLQAGAPAAEPWFVELFRCGVFENPGTLTPQLLERHSALKDRLALRGCLEQAPTGLCAFDGRGNRTFYRQALGIMGMVLIPVENFYHGMLYARLSIRVQTVTGARSGELLQMTHTKDRWGVVDGIGDKDESRAYFMAVPKGGDHAKPRPYILDDDTMDAVLETVRFTKERFGHNGRMPIVKPAHAIREKCGSDRYIFTQGRKAIELSGLNLLYEVLLAGVASVHVHDPRHAFANRALEDGVPVDILAGWLNQKNVLVTKYYGKATRRQNEIYLDTFFGRRVNLKDLSERSPADMQDRLNHATQQVGSLQQVIGGVCTKATACDHRFACVGCASNVPDPRKRRQVEQSRDAAVSMREFFAREGLKADVRKHEEVIHDHDLFLREMRSIEEYRTEGFFQVRLESGSR
jgi:hypothetical protein